MQLMGSVPALLTGLLYDAKSLELATELAARLDYDVVERARPELVAEGLSARLGGEPIAPLAMRIVEIADGGLARRAHVGSAGADERIHLAPLAELVSAGQCPADRLLAGARTGAKMDVRELLRRAHL
jgi:glutamate--cysteine ligase